MPFFYVPGNHDISNPYMSEKWDDRFGENYYYFLYKNVLFLCLNSQEDNEYAGKSIDCFSDEQVKWVKNTLEKNKSVRWTFIFMHQPVWIDSKRIVALSKKLEPLLQDREYTFFTGHKHHYTKFIRHGKKYFILGPTGGESKLRGPEYGEIDEIAWVTVTNSGPIVANLDITGIYDENFVTEKSKNSVGSQRPIHQKTRHERIVDKINTITYLSPSLISVGVIILTVIYIRKR
jgi:hypothetical protein